MQQDDSGDPGTIFSVVDAFPIELVRFNESLPADVVLANLSSTSLCLTLFDEWLPSCESRV